ncbi:Hypothetical_protein [Hexamita inflata]|uniref:Hypothetical_protein n=1 Tax=Hexamita inflata TaxID=28002 RepID=A0AA86P3S6_9EUKA|nr:Hypothetical protein HINF_LOCUS18763 [Hexamita inflata]
MTDIQSYLANVQQDEQFIDIVQNSSFQIFIQPILDLAKSSAKQLKQKEKQLNALTQELEQTQLQLQNSLPPPEMPEDMPPAEDFPPDLPPESTPNNEILQLAEAHSEIQNKDIQIKNLEEQFSKKEAELQEALDLMQKLQNSRDSEIQLLKEELQSFGLNTDSDKQELEKAKTDIQNHINEKLELIQKSQHIQDKTIQQQELIKQYEGQLLSLEQIKKENEEIQQENSNLIKQLEVNGQQKQLTQNDTEMIKKNDMQALEIQNLLLQIKDLTNLLKLKQTELQQANESLEQVKQGKNDEIKKLKQMIENQKATEEIDTSVVSLAAMSQQKTTIQQQSDEITILKQQLLQANTEIQAEVTKQAQQIEEIKLLKQLLQDSKTEIEMLQQGQMQSDDQQVNKQIQLLQQNYQEKKQMVDKLLDVIEKTKEKYVKELNEQNFAFKQSNIQHRQQLQQQQTEHIEIQDKLNEQLLYLQEQVSILTNEKREEEYKKTKSELDQLKKRLITLEQEKQEISNILQNENELNEIRNSQQSQQDQLFQQQFIAEKSLRLDLQNQLKKAQTKIQQLTTELEVYTKTGSQAFKLSDIKLQKLAVHYQKLYEQQTLETANLTKSNEKLVKQLKESKNLHQIETQILKSELKSTLNTQKVGAEVINAEKDEIKRITKLLSKRETEITELKFKLQLSENNLIIQKKQMDRLQNQAEELVQISNYNENGENVDLYLLKKSHSPVRKNDNLILSQDEDEEKQSFQIKSGLKSGTKFENNTQKESPLQLSIRAAQMMVSPKSPRKDTQDLQNLQQMFINGKVPVKELWNEYQNTNTRKIKIRDSQVVSPELYQSQ